MTEQLETSTTVVQRNTEAIHEVQKMEQITTSNEQILQHLSQTQKEISQEVLRSQQNLLETSEILKQISSR